MTSSADEHSAEWHLGEAFTAYCFGGLSDQARHEVEEHLLGCDACWEEFRALDAAVRTLRSDAAVRPTLPLSEVVSLLGLSGRLDRPFGGHRTLVVTVAALYGLQWTASLWTELGYAYDRFGTLAWGLSLPVAAWMTAALALALRSDARAARIGRTSGLARAITMALVGIAALVMGLMLILPAEPTILASFQTRTASGGFLKNAILHFLPLLIFILPPFDTVLRLQRELGRGRYEPVLRVLSHHSDRVPPRGMLYLSPLFLTALLLVIGIIKIVGMNYMLDGLTPGPYAHLFTISSYVSTGLWFAMPVMSLAWYQSCVNELKRESRALALLQSGDRRLREH